MIGSPTNKRRFTPADPVGSLVDADYNLLSFLSRFSLPLGFSDKTIKELCDESGISTDIFLLVVNFALTGEIDPEKLERSSASDIATFLLNSHHYYLNYKFPHIRANLIEAFDPAHADINPILLSYFDRYISKVENHFRYEEEVVFPYVGQISEGKSPQDYSIDHFTRRHDHEVEDSLDEMKNIIMRYYNTSIPYRMYDVLVDIFNCEEDLALHSRIEDEMLVPRIKLLEKNLHKNSSDEAVKK
ncbi:MAG: hemerythrin domain-containing protein [Duncaniella sp.]|nr:hemerythrin domain-containing protein [Duncaniella sp.]